MIKYVLFFLLFLNFQASAQINLVSDIYPGTPGSDPIQLTPFNNKLYFNANDGTHGRELFVYDGVNKPILVNDLNTGLYDGMLNQIYNQKMGVIGNKIYFGGNNGITGFELYSYNGADTPRLEKDIDTGYFSSYPQNFFTYNNKIYFTAQTDSFGMELYIYDGNTLNLIDINAGTGSSNPKGFVAYNNKVYFSATTSANGYEPYVYDPSTNTAALVADVNTGFASSFPSGFTVLGSKLYFYANDGTYGYELYSYDGNTVTRITDLAPGALGGVYGAIGVYNNVLIFSGSTNGVNYQLYKYDPSTSLTSLITNIYPGGNSNPNNFTLYKTKIYFAATDSAHGVETWVYDGNSASLVMDLYPGKTGSVANSSVPSDYTVFNGNLYLNATNGITGYELYKFYDNTSVQNILFEGSIKVFPNPASEKVFLSVTLPKAMQMSLTVTDVTGKTIYSIPSELYSASKNTITIPIKSVSPGVYFYHLYSTGNIQLAAGKFVKE